MQSPNNLDIWHRAIDLAVRIDELASHLPGRNAPGIANQMRRSSTSIPANIAEGAGQMSPAQCGRFISMAIASAFELQSHLVLAQRLCPDLPDLTETLDELQQIRRMMYSFREYQRKRAQNTAKRTQ